jgi:hypothetical protein
MATYRLTIQYGHALTSYGEINWNSKVRWRWTINEQVLDHRWDGKVMKNKQLIYGRTRWRWIAVWRSKRALKKLTSGIDILTEHGDLDARISKLEKELQLA